MKDYLFTERMVMLVGASPTGTPPGPAASSSWRPPTPSPPWTSGTRPSSTRSRSEHGNLVCFQHCSDPGAAGVRHLPQVAQVLLLHVSRAAARHARRHPPRAAPRPDRHREAPRRGGGQVHGRARAARGARAGHHPHLPGHPRLHPGDQVHADIEMDTYTNCAQEKALLVFPGPRSKHLDQYQRHLATEPTPGQAAPPFPYNKIVFIDSTWNQCHKICQDYRIQSLPQVWRQQQKNSTTIII